MIPNIKKNKRKKKQHNKNIKEINMWKSVSSDLFFFRRVVAYKHYGNQTPYRPLFPRGASSF